MTLGPGGVKTDIVTGNVLEDHPQAKKEALEKKARDSVARSMELQADLRGEGGMILEALIQNIADYVDKLLANDVVYQQFIRFLFSLGKEISITPMIMDRHLRTFLPQFERRSAPVHRDTR